MRFDRTRFCFAFCSIPIRAAIPRPFATLFSLAVSLLSTCVFLRLRDASIVVRVDRDDAAFIILLIKKKKNCSITDYFDICLAGLVV